MRKKGSALDVFMFIVVSFCVVLICVSFLFIGDQIKSKLDEVATENDMVDQAVVDSTMGKLNQAFASFPWLTTFFILALCLAIPITSMFVDAHPVFFIAHFFLMILAVIVAVVVSNSYEVLMNNADLTTEFAKFGSTNWLMLRLPVISTIVGFLGGTIMYIKTRGKEEYY